MSFTVAGWDESQDSATIADVAALTDQHITVQGDDIVVPTFADRLAAVLALGANITQARLTAPSLREQTELDVAPLNVNAEPVAPTPWMPIWDDPRQLTPGEGLRAQAAEDAAGAARSTVLAWFLGEDVAVPDGTVETVRTTATTTLTANVWTIATMTLSQQLRAGNYAIVGMRAESAGLVAARAVIPGSPYRPGCIGYDAAGDVEHSMFRDGNLGRSWGEFNHRFFPQVEFLSRSADTAETVWWDLIHLGG